MAVNWNAFLTDEGLTLPDEQWSDFQQTSTDPFFLSQQQMPKPTPTRKPAADGGDLTGFDPLFIGPNFADSLFNNPNDYFLSDLEILQPFGDTLAGETTSESSPEPTSGVSLTGPFTQTDVPSSLSRTPASASTGLDQSPQMGNLQQQQRRNVSRAQPFANPAYESMFPHSLNLGFVEGLSFPNGTTGNANPSDSNEKSFNEETTIKRSKNKPDILSACWTSPLCPNNSTDTDDPPPNPSNCGGGCAPFLFAPDDNLRTPTIDNSINEPQEVIAEDGIVEIQPRPKKRSESESSSSEPTGRHFPNPNASPRTNSNSNSTKTTSNPNDTRLKTESSENPSPQQQPSQASATADDASKPKPRRRLPHNQVERKYRESLNTQLESLRRVVPALQQPPRPACPDGADIEDLPAPSKPSKAVILASATAHIKQLEKENKTVQEENQLLRARIKALQALVKCEDCSLMQYVMDLKINPGQGGVGGVGGGQQQMVPQAKCAS
ncbi:uncharacterized protein EI97DRAFT_276733 [Westerdykella ornata]|uniref:BHLH domain-containing protein n=1 Tax=Westerdykella ornata TaxID=318751 RepID=A0A6A6JP04_WESOR|nr:uncharacterized protein EI97DRAFT_276733 [Westerdykella ornata]KAF2277873.1 hypothetical protein EI97DRAFT_276733 [Westerdykella ornata]